MAPNASIPLLVSHRLPLRFIDVLDGIVARKTGQTSDFGALLDAGLDKAVTAIILYEIKSKKLAPTEIIAAITAFNGINAVASAKTIVESGDETVRPEISGKLALALETSSLLAHLVGSRLETTGQSPSSPELLAVSAI